MAAKLCGYEARLEEMRREVREAERSAAPPAAPISLEDVESLLADLNTEPRTTYLAAPRNPNAELEC